MRAHVQITDNTAQARSTQINNVALSAYSLDETNRPYLLALGCPNTLVVKNRLKASKDKLLYQSIEWILKHPQYKDWQDGHNVCLLWIKGGAGKGKTMMSIGIIEDLSKSQRESTIVTYAFCQNADCELNTLEAIIKGLILQLVNQQPALNQYLRDRWDTENQCFREDISSWQALWHIFLEMLTNSTCQRVYVIVDALDECESDSDSVAGFLQLLVRSGLDQPHKIKWLLTSRPLDIAQRELLAAADQVQVSLELNLKHIAKAVEIYISYKVSELSRRHLYGDQLRQELQTELIQRAEGTFLWVSLVCKELENVCRDKALATIRGLPRGLDAFYTRIIKQLLVSMGERSDVQKYVRIFTVMIKAYRPLNLKEICSVTGLTDDDDAIKVLMDRCASLIKIQENKLEFIHKSARDYLAGDNKQLVLFPDENFGTDQIVSECLSYLSKKLAPNIARLTKPDSTQESLTAPKNDDEKVLLARVDYAATFWVQHLEDINLAPAKSSSKDATYFALEGNPALVDAVFIFLRTKFLEWLECLSLLRKLPQAIVALRILANFAKNHHRLQSLVQDARRFLSRHYQTITNWPLQVYSSAVTFSPELSTLKRESKEKIPIWLRKSPTMEENWASLVQTMENSSMPVNSVAFSPNAELIASGSDDDTVKLWNSATGEIFKSLENHSEKVSSVAFSPDGKYIASGSWDCTVNIWECMTGDFELHMTIKAHARPVTAIAFSPDSQQIASSSHDNTLKLWNATSGDFERHFPGHSDQITAIAFSLDSKQIVSSASDNTVKLWDTRTGSLQRTFRGHSSPVMAVVFSFDNKHIISGAYDGTIKIWDVSTAILEKDLEGHSDQVTALAISPDGKQIASVSFDKTVKLWDAMTTDLQITLEGHSDWVNTVAFTPGGQQIISGSSDKTIKLWDATIIDFQRPLASHSGAVTAIAFSPDGRSMISGGGLHDYTVRLWDTLTGDHRGAFKGHSNEVTAVALSPDGKSFVSSSYENDIKLWSSRTGNSKGLVGHSDWVNTVAFSPDGKRIASGSHDNTVMLWDSQSGNHQITLKGHTGPVTAIAFSSDGDRLASASNDNTIKIWNVTRSPKALKCLGQTFGNLLLLRQEIITTKSISTIRFSSDNRNLETNVGPIKLESLTRGKRSTTANSTAEPTTEPLKDIWVHDQWICYGEIPFFWLPSYYALSCFIVQDDQLAIGFKNGRVLRFEFDRRCLESMLGDQCKNC